MEGPFSFDKDRKKAIIALLLQMAAVDHQLESTEQVYIHGIAEQMELEGEELVTISQAPENYPFSVPQNEQERMTILYYLLFLVRADGKITDAEESLCFKMGLKLGFNHNLIADLIAVLKVYLKKDVPPEAMLEKVRKYMN